MKKTLYMLLAAFIFLTALSCKKDEPDVQGGTETLNFMIVLPSSIEGAAGDPVTLKFYSGKGPVNTDKVVLKNATAEFVCPIIALTSDSFSFEIPEGMTSGRYKLGICRGEQIKVLGEVPCTIEVRVEVEEKEGYNIYGIITCDEKGVPGVVVSDGEVVVVTDENGIYYMKSSEYNGYVFMSVPSGYEAQTEGVLPKFHKLIDGNKNTTERVDFSLSKVDNSSYVLYVLGDMHLANRTSDLSQFSNFTSDLQKQIDANTSKRQYAITLGDMSWDLYWYDNAYDLYSYVKTLQTSLNGVSVFHTIGNHDHDMKAAGDFNTVYAFKQAIGPTYYSFNLGDIHYVVLDNILCTNSGSGDRTYESSFTQEQLAWLREDLKYVDKSRTVVVTMHAQMYNEDGSAAMDNTSAFEEIVNGYKVHVLSAHTHVVWNNDLSAKNIFHHNSGAVCATWWWTGHLSGIHLCRDGAPGGYYVYNVQGNNMQWKYKATGKDVSHQFRTYDRNRIVLDAATYAPKASTSGATAFNKSASTWSSSNSDNYVYFNVWNYDPSWKIEVTENGKVLPWEISKVKDPLHLASYEAKRYNSGSTPTSSFTARTVLSHMFRVKASSADSDLVFKITDRFGNQYTETMNRPKAFSIDAYK